MKRVFSILIIFTLFLITSCSRGPLISSQQKGYNRVYDAQEGFRITLKTLEKAKNDEEACYALKHAKLYSDSLERIMTNRARITSDPDQYTKEELIISEDILKVAAPANAQAKLKLGDLSLHHNCNRMAEESYQYVFDVFVGEEYKEFREEARQGLVDVYTKIQQKI